MRFFPRHPVFSTFSGILLLGLGLCVCGCASLPRSGIDPSGERLFAETPLSTGSSRSGNCLLPTRSPDDVSIFPGALSDHLLPERCRTETDPVTTTLPPKSTATSPASTAPSTLTQDSSLPGGFGSVGSAGTGPLGTSGTAYASTATSPNRVNGIVTAMVPETAEGVESARPIGPIEGPALVMTPREQIAPLGSEVVLISSFLGNDQRLRTNEPVEWSLDGVGHIVSIDPGNLCDPLLLDFRQAKKLSDKFARTKTSSHEQRIHRGTVDPRDDIHILRGQSWISVNSTKEGATSVTAVATNMKDWSKRGDGATIHWVDAQWILPQSMIAAVGSTRTLTTTVQRRTNKTPRPNWVVRYEILGGPQAELHRLGAVAGERGSQVIDVQTDGAGQAGVTLHQLDRQAGTNVVAIRIIRPASADGNEPAVTLGNETFRQTWASGSTFAHEVIGPPSLKLGNEAEYRISVTNNAPTTMSARVSLPVPSGMTYMRAEPPPNADSINPPGPGRQPTLVWDSAPIASGGTLVVTVTLRPEARGTFEVTAEVAPRSVLGTVVQPPSTEPYAPLASGNGVTPAPYAPVSPANPVTPTPYDGSPSTTSGSTNPVVPAPYSSGGTVSSATSIEARLVESPLRPGSDSADMRVAYALLAKNTTGQTLYNLRLAVYALGDGTMLVPVSITENAVYDTSGHIWIDYPSLAPNQEVALRIGYRYGRNFSYQTLQGEVFLDNRSVTKAQLVVGSK